MSEYADWLEQWATTEGMGVLDELGTEEFCDPTVEPADEQEWSPDQWQYWCRGKRTAVELLRIWEVLL